MKDSVRDRGTDCLQKPDIPTALLLPLRVLPSGAVAGWHAVNVLRVIRSRLRAYMGGGYGACGNVLRVIRARLRARARVTVSMRSTDRVSGSGRVRIRVRTIF